MILAWDTANVCMRLRDAHLSTDAVVHGSIRITGILNSAWEDLDNTCWMLRSLDILRTILKRDIGRMVVIILLVF